MSEKNENGDEINFHFIKKSINKSMVL